MDPGVSPGPREPSLAKLRIKPKPRKAEHYIIEHHRPRGTEDVVVVDVSDSVERAVVIRDTSAKESVNRLEFVKKLKGVFSGAENSKRVDVIDTREVNLPSLPLPPLPPPTQSSAIPAPDRKQAINSTPNPKSKSKPKPKPKPKPTGTPEFPTTDVSKPVIQPLLNEVINGIPIVDRLPAATKPVIIKRDKYMLNNRKAFVNFINEMFQPYRQDILEEARLGAGAPPSKIDLFTHQKLVRDYINLYTPYRGLLLYHGLGSGKTCTSIGIAEGIIKASAVAMGEAIGSNRKVIVMTPASLRANYFEELKKCGNPIYRKNQHWEFIDTVRQPEHVDTLSNVLHLPVTSIQKQKGAWLVDVSKEPNYDTLGAEQQNSLEVQLDDMIRSKFIFHNYNNPNLKKDVNTTMTNNHTINPFDNKVVIIDEAHNFISRIVNNINPDYKRVKKEDRPVAINLYDYLMKAENCRIVLLTGTPIINYPNEIGVIYNILRGYIVTYEFTIESQGSTKINATALRRALDPDKSVDYMELRNNTLLITRNPMGFVNTPGLVTYKGVAQATPPPTAPAKQLGNVAYMNHIIKRLAGENFRVVGKKVELSKALPDKLEAFVNEFIDSNEGDIKNQFLFKKRILGLTSFLNDKEDLMPKYDENDPNDYHKVYVPMSSYMFPLYQETRKEERNRDKKGKGGVTGPGKGKGKGPGGKAGAVADGLFDKATSSYRVASRAMCNFAFPEEIPRPRLIVKKGSSTETGIVDMDEDDLDAISAKERGKNVDGIGADAPVDADGSREDARRAYAVQIRDTLSQLDEHKSTYLTEPRLSDLSPKFAHILGNIVNPANEGLHLVYSQFRTLEGVGVFALTLEANGFAQLKLRKNEKNNFVLDIPDDHEPGKLFALYTGTETTEEKETMRKIYNSEWNQLPNDLVTQLKDIAPNNHMGDLVRILMITQSGAEGINLKNTRFVHIMEPYWHPVRTKQVIGRARRIRSHDDLPKELRTVKAFLYMTEFSEEQHNTMPIDLKKNDQSKYDKTNTRALTTDQSLFEISNRKENINRKLTTAIKESAMDCALYDHSGEKDSIECHSFGLNLDPKDYAFVPDLADEDKTENITNANRPDVKLNFQKVVLDGIDHAMRVTEGKKPTFFMYTYDSYREYAKNPNKGLVYIGKAERVAGKFVLNTNVQDDFKLM